MPQDFPDDSENDKQQGTAFDYNSVDTQELPFLSINFVQQVDELVSLAHYGPSIVLILGEDGIGKTCTLEHLENETTEIGQIRIDGNPMLSIDQLHASFLQQLNNYEQAVEYNSVRDSLLRASEIAEQLILVDDAQQLSTSVLESLISLVSPVEQSPAVPVRLFLFGNADLKHQLKMETFPETAVYCLQLNGFEKEEISSFLAQQLNLSEDEIEESFNTKTLSQIWKDSHGNPGQIIRSLVSDDIELEDVEEITASPIASIVFRSILILLGAALLLLALFGEKWFGEKWLQADTQAENKMDEAIVLEIKSPAENDIELKQTALKTEIKSTNVSEIPEQQSEEKIAEPAQPEEKDILVNDQILASQTTTSIPPVIVDTSIQETAIDIKTSAEDGNSESTVVAIKIPAKIEAGDKIVESKVVTRLAAEVAKRVTTEPGNAFTANESYLLEQPKNHYSVQLVGLSNLQEMEKFVGQLESSQALYIYRSMLNGNPWYILVAGNYADANSARTAKDHFNSNLKKFNPWIKSYAKIQSEIQLAADSRK